METLNVSKTFFSKLFAPSDSDFFFYKELYQMALEIQNKTSNTVSIKKYYFFWSEVNYHFKLREDEKKLLSLYLSPSCKLFFSASK